MAKKLTPEMRAYRNALAKPRHPHNTLASMCAALSMVHAIAPELVFVGAVKKGISGRELIQKVKQDLSIFTDLMFAD